MIKFDCPCGKPLRVKDELAGRRVRCPGCGRAVVVPVTPVQRGPRPRGEPARGEAGEASG